MGWCQQGEDLPQIQPSRSIRLDGNALLGDYCIEDILIDETGRMFMPSCGAIRFPFRIYLFQYDGYNFRPIELGNQQDDVFQSCSITGYDEKLGIFGFSNQGNGEVKVFYYRHQIDSLFFLSDLVGKVSDVISETPGQLMLVTKQENALVISRWDGTSTNQLAEIPFPVPKKKNGDLLPGSRANLKKEGSYLYYLDKCWPILRYNLDTQETDLFDGSSFPDYAEHQVCIVPRNPTFQDLEVVNTTIYCLNTLHSPKFYVCENGIGPFKPLPVPLHGGAGRGIYKDKTGNLIFHYTIGRNKQKAFLLDSSGQYWDYSPMLEGLSGVNHILGADFREEVFIATAKGVYLVQTKDNRTIANFLEGTGLRWIGEIGPNNYVIKGEGARGIYRVDTDTNLEQEIKVDMFSQLPSLRPRGLTNAPGNRLFIFSNERNNLGLITVDLGKPDQKTAFQSFGKQVILNIAYVPEEKLAFFQSSKKQLYWYDLKKRTTEPALLKGQPVQFPNIRINDVLGSREGILWIATVTGIYKIDPQAEAMFHYDLSAKDLDYRIVTLQEDQKGRILAGTVKNGIQILEPETGEVVQIINAEKGLSNNTVVSILEDEEGDFWVGTFHGLNIVSPDGKVKYKLYKEDGLTSNEFNRYSFYKDSQGRLLMGTIRGLNIIDPIPLKQSLIKREATHIYISKLSYFDKVQGKEVSIYNFEPADKRLTLPASNRYLKVEVALSNYGFSKESNFIYKLEGIDQNWNYLSKQNRIYLSNLPPGRYRLLINGIDEHGNWTQTPVAIKIHSQDFFYRQTWFLLLCFGFLGVTAYVWIDSLRRKKSRLEKEVESRTQQIVKDKELIEQQAEELKEMDKIKSRFFANISHEFRTPLTLIQGPIEKLKEEQQLSGRGHKYLKLMEGSARKLMQQISDLLDLSAMESSKLELKERTVNLYQLTNRLAASFESLAVHKSIQLSFAFHLDQSWHVQLDQEKFEKIFNNYLTNALKYTPKDGEIRVIVESSELGFKMMVSDTGAGIHEDDLPHLFERFFQGRQSTEGGSGIGLALCRELAQLMNGKVYAESKLGEGSHFYLELPLKKLSSVPVDAPSINNPVSVLDAKNTTTVSTSTENASKILIVEDNPSLREYLAMELQKYHTFFAEHGEEALEKLQQDPAIDLIISDVMMPIMDGYELLSRLKTHPEWQKLPVIMLTAKAAEEDKLQALRLGVDDYLTKPFSPKELIARMENLIHNYTQRRIFLEESKEARHFDFEQTVSADEEWLQELEEILVSSLDKRMSVNVNYLADKMAVSDRQFLRRIKGLTGLSAKQYIQEARLAKARQLLENKTYQTVGEVAYAIGFNTPGYFTRVYEQRFGKRPLEYLQH